MTTRPPFLRWLLLASAMLATDLPALTISPVLIELSPDRKIASVTLSNPTDQAMTFQVETLTWSQTDGTNHYQSTDDLLVAPPIAEIAPQSSQLFRVTLRRPISDTSEHAYRLILEDVTGVLTPQPGIIALRFKHNLPVYASPSNETKAIPRWSRCSATTGQICIRLDNDGNRRLRVSELTITGQDWQQTIQGGAVLAGAWKQWVFAASGRSQPGRITAKTELGEISADLSTP